MLPRIMHKVTVKRVVLAKQLVNSKTSFHYIIVTNAVKNQMNNEKDSV